MSLRKNERCPIRNSFFCCRWKQLRRQREFASPVREGINQILPVASREAFRSLLLEKPTFAQRLRLDDVARFPGHLV